MKQMNAKILRNDQIAPDFFDLRADCPEAAAEAKPGQFVHILTGDKPLRRPISICDAENGTLRFVYEVRGEGTGLLSGMKPGENLDFLGPLGNGFDLSSGNVLLVGGGLGAPPLLYAAKACKGKAEVALGFRTKTTAILLDDFKKETNRVFIATDDGTLGIHGLVSEPVRNRLAESVGAGASARPFDLVCACGPIPMLKATAALAHEYGVRCLVSLEERMACGIGACLVCACALKGQSQYAQVCKGGPVFDAEKLDW